MNQKTKDRTLYMIKMRLDGCTYQEIADKYGLTRQCVQQAIADFTGKERVPKSFDRTGIIYPNMLKWMDENGITLAELSRIIGIGEGNSSRTSKKMRGKTNFRMSEIKAILKESGQTFEYMFAENEHD